MRKRSFLITILSIFFVTLIGCSSSNQTFEGAASSDQSSMTDSVTDNSTGADNKEEISQMPGNVENATTGNAVNGVTKDEVSQVPSNSNNVTTDNSTQVSRKIIDRADVILETLEFDKSISQLESSINSYGGYIESSNILQDGISSGSYKQNRYAEFIIRIPKEKFQSFLSETGNIGVIINKRIYGEDISSQYYDRESRLKVLQAQEQKYLDLLNNAKEVKEILEIEKSLTEIRYEIESLTGYLKQMDSLVSYSTINLNISEVTETKVAEATPKTFGDKVVKAFSDSIKSLKTAGITMVLIIVVILPYAIIFSILGYIIYFVIKRYKSKKK